LIPSYGRIVENNLSHVTQILVSILKFDIG
jgi:hypothetical protein